MYKVEPIVPADIPTEAQKVMLSFNSITSIPAGVFSHLALCKSLQTDQNKISLVDQEAFVGLESLRFLGMESNQLSFLRPDTFAGLYSLSSIHLSFNFFSVIPYGMLRGPPGLTELHLESNPISNIQAVAFNHLPLLKQIYLFNTSLTTLDSDLFTELPRPLQLHLSFGTMDNQWNCSSLCWLKSEEQQGMILLQQPPACAGDKNWRSLKCPNPGEVISFPQFKWHGKVPNWRTFFFRQSLVRKTEQHICCSNKTMMFFACGVVGPVWHEANSCLSNLHQEATGWACSVVSFCWGRALRYTTRGFKSRRKLSLEQLVSLGWMLYCLY